MVAVKLAGILLKFRPIPLGILYKRVLDAMLKYIRGSCVNAMTELHVRLKQLIDGQYPNLFKNIEYL